VEKKPTVSLFFFYKRFIKQITMNIYRFFIKETEQSDFGFYC